MRQNPFDQMLPRCLSLLIGETYPPLVVQNEETENLRDRESGLAFCLGIRIENKGQELNSSVGLFLFEVGEGIFRTAESPW